MLKFLISSSLSLWVFLVKLATLVIGFLFSVSCTQKSRYFCQFWKAWKSYRFYMTLSKCIWVNCSLKSNIMEIFFQWFVSLCQEREISKPHQCQKGRNAGGKCQHRYLKTLKKPAASLKVKQSKPDASENTGIDILREEILSPETQSLETVIGWRNWMWAVDVEEKNTISQSEQEPNAHLTPVYMNGGCWETINDARHPEILNASYHYPIISHAINSHSLVVLENIVRLTLQQHLYFCNVGVTVKHWLCVISWRCSQAAVVDL